MKTATSCRAEAALVGLPTTDPRIPIVSVFSGAGGLDVGFALEGFETIFAADYMPAAVKTFNHNARREVAFVIDLLKESSVEVASKITKAVNNGSCPPRGLIGGPPCQGVSAANNLSSPADPRNKLFSRYINLVGRLDEKYGLDFFVFENVPGLKSKKNAVLYKKIVRALGKNFSLYESTIDALDFGVPQSRKRLIVVGFNKRLEVADFDFPSVGVELGYKNVKEVMSGLPEPHYFDRREPHSRSSFHPNHWTMGKKSVKFKADEAYEPPKNARSFIRLEWDKPSRTVAYGNREIHLHPDGFRRLSIYEAMRLQGFPKEFEICGNFSEQVTQVSNAVPPPLAQAVARSVKKALDSLGVTDE